MKVLREFSCHCLRSFFCWCSGWLLGVLLLLFNVGDLWRWKSLSGELVLFLFSLFVRGFCCFICFHRVFCFLNLRVTLFCC